MMERSLRSILDSIKSFFTFPQFPLQERDRKRRAQPIDIPIRSKISRFSPYPSPLPANISHIERESDELSSLLTRRADPIKTSFRLSGREPMRPLKPEDVVVIDDDDDVIEVRKRNSINRGDFRSSFKKYTSTPTEKKLPIKKGLENQDDDVILVKTIKSPKEKQLNLEGFKASTSTDKPLFDIGIHNLSKSKNRTEHRKSPSLDYSFRLDHKMKYKKLLEQSNNESSIYLTPIGKIFKNFDFTNSNDKKSPGSNKSQDRPKESTKERIVKVLDSLENDAVVVKDSDSEDSVVFVSPPSPKPDIKVDPVNSLKTIVDTSVVTKKDWLAETVERHKQFVQERQREIDNIRQYSKQNEELNKEINIELLRRKVNDCLQLKDLILPEIELETDAELPELTQDQVYMAQIAFRGDPKEVLARKFNLNITRRDLMTLAGLNWLNDEVINFYMNLIIERGKDSKWPNAYAFNTFFYMKLIKDGAQSLRRWTKRVDLFSYDLVCVPIHLGMHWCMAIIDFRDKSIRYYDSMGSPNTKCLEALRYYLESEHMDKKKTRYDTSDFSLVNMDDIPQQMNGSDCGMFSCTFAEFITRNAKITFKQKDMPYLRKKMVVEIMTGELLVK
ncbi:uncharacterized protein [Euwallacea similis]|uniref:uncharacterized protein n=1 Tax=Euwallacea similis TaxID=1736056 RepID=UPI00344B1B1D